MITTRWTRAAAFLAPLIVGAVALVSATPTSPVEAGLPETSRTCADCHAEVYRSFLTNTHARLGSHEYRGTLGGCEACHGPAEAHLSSGDPSDMHSFASARPEQNNARCVACHDRQSLAGWRFGAHARNGLACGECHTIHKGNGKPPANQPKLCGTCHSDIRARMNFPSRHPVREGKMGCTSCHNPHGGGEVDSLLTTERRNDLCLGCHTRYQGPFIFEHSPVAEDCLICHDPHGTAANNLLKQNEPFLCLQCHTSHFHLPRVPDTGTVTLASGHTVTNRWGSKGFIKAFGTKCTQCHVRVHGSDLPSQGTTSRGGSLTR